MYTVVPTDYYHIHQIFEFLGRDTFRYRWTGLELELAQKTPLWKKIPEMEKTLLKRLDPFFYGLYAKEQYEIFVKFTEEQSGLWSEHLEELTSRLTNEISYHSEKEGNISIFDLVAPFPNISDFMNTLMRALIIKKRLSLMMDGIHINGYVHDTLTGEIACLSYSVWLRSLEIKYGDNKDADIFAGTGIVQLSDGHKFEVYKGPLMLAKKSFDLIRSGERPPLEHDFPCKYERELAAYEKERLERKEMQTTLEVLEAEPETEEEKISLQEIEEVIVEQVTAPFEGSTYMKLLVQCFKDLKISPTNQPSKRAVEAWILQHAPILKSQRERDYFFTFLREPEMKKGGVFTGKVRKRSKISSS